MNRRRFLRLSLGLMFAPVVASARGKIPIGIIFVARSDCPYCRVIAPVLHNLRADTGIDVLCVALDARPVPPLPSFVDGTVQLQRGQYRSVPHVMIVNHRLERVTHHITGYRNARHFVTRLSRSLRESSVL